MVSIIIPTYNYAEYLAETLNSVNGQSYHDWECIIFDDGSEDETKEVAAKFVKQDDRFKYFYQKNSGVSAARNNAIKMAKGEFIQFLDGDDLLQEDKLRSQIEAFEKNKEIDIVYNEVRFFDDGKMKKLRTSLRGDKNDDWMPKVSGKGESIVTQFSRINFMVMNTPLIRTRVFAKVGVFNEDMKALEDWDFWMRCALSDCCFYFNASVNAAALVRVHPGSLSTQKTQMNEGHFLFLRNSMEHGNLNFKYKIILAIKYVELFWDSLLKNGYFESGSLILAAVSILMFPFYLIIKLMRIVKR